MTAYEARAQKQIQQRISDHEADQLEERRQQTIRDMQNAATRKQYLAGLESQKAEKRKLQDIEIDRILEPQKVILRNEWLANHPGKASTDFDKAAWPHLRANLVAEREAEAFTVTRDSMIANLGVNSI